MPRKPPQEILLNKAIRKLKKQKKSEDYINSYIKGWRFVDKPTNAK